MKHQLSQNLGENLGGGGGGGHGTPGPLLATALKIYLGCHCGFTFKLGFFGVYFNNTLEKLNVFQDKEFIV